MNARSKSKHKRKYFYLPTTEDEVFFSIFKAGSVGILQKDVAADTGIHRDTVYETTKVLRRKGRIDIIRLGRTTRYVVTIQGLNDFEDVYLNLLTFYASKNLLSTVNLALIDNDLDTLGGPTIFDSPF